MGAATTQASDRVRFGIDGLDNVLFGGLVRHNHVLLEGPAGSGKTTLALSFLYAGALCSEHHEAQRLQRVQSLQASSPEPEPGLFVSFEMSPSKLLRDAHGFGWELADLMRQGTFTAIEATPAFLLQDLRIEHGAFAHQLRAHGIKRLVIDGLTPLRLAFERSAMSKAMSFRTCLQQLLGALTRLGVTTIVTSESDGLSSAQLADERYVFDTLITLKRGMHTDRGHASANQRALEIVKSRGQDFVEGRHTLRIEAGRGAVVYQRAQSREPSYRCTQGPELRELHSFGSPAIDQLFGGGLYSGSITLVHGTAGTGKTVAGLQFLVAGAQQEQAQAGLMVSLDEQPAQLIRNAKTLDFPIEALVDSEQLCFLYDSPLDLDLDVHFDCIVKLVERQNIRRIVFDSLARYEQHEKVSGQDVNGFLYAVAAFCKARGVLVVFNYDSPERQGLSPLGDALSINWKGVQSVDNIVLLSYAELATGLRRAIAVPKARGRRTVQLMREYVIGSGGLTLADVADEDQLAGPTAATFAGYLNLLSRSPAGAGRESLEPIAASALPLSAELQRSQATE